MNNSLIGQYRLRQTLLEMYEKGRLSHALLFAGQTGVGALPLALYWAKFLICKNKNGGIACGECPSCYKISKYIHPDIHFSFPVFKKESSSTPPISADFMEQWQVALLENPYITEQQWYNIIKTENKQGTINVREAERIIYELGFKPYEADYKILIMWLPERLNETAANKLLKLIEEPPEGTYFFFVTEDREAVLQTILSRCVTIWVPPIEREAIEEELTRNWGLDNERAMLYAHICGGSFSKALELISPNNDTDINALYHTRLMEYSIKKQPLDLFNWGEEVATKLNREQQKNLVLYMLNMLRDYYTISLQQNHLALLTNEQKRQASEITSHAKPGFFENTLNECDRAIKDLEGNVNAKYIFCTLAFNISSYLK